MTSSYVRTQGRRRYDAYRDDLYLSIAVRSANVLAVTESILLDAYSDNFNSASALPWANFALSAGDSDRLSRKARPWAFLA